LVKILLLAAGISLVSGLIEQKSEGLIEFALRMRITMITANSNRSTPILLDGVAWRDEGCIYFCAAEIEYRGVSHGVV
ncbi:MAG: hypothetical protein ACKO6L_05350, partial [Flavobacteriales bacterium]